MSETIQVTLRQDAEGYLGRECPSCERYFKIMPGTGIKGPAPCHCPYCGHQGDGSTFHTPEQIEYAKSIALRKMMGDVRQMLKSMEGPIGPQNGFIKMSMTLREGSPVPIFQYREKDLETYVLCEQCTLNFAIYGVFAYCPDCGAHNSLLMLNRNLDLIEKMLAVAKQQEGDIRDQLVADSLENAVSAFDAFGRESVRIAPRPDGQAELTCSFQNLSGANQRLVQAFGIKLLNLVTEEWKSAVRGFQKRHLLAHTMGVVDHAYIKATSDPSAVIGRKVTITPDEVTELVGILRKLGSALLNALRTQKILKPE